MAFLLTVLLIALGTKGYSQESQPTQETQAASPKTSLDGITFASVPGRLYISIHEFCESFGEAVSDDPDSDSLTIKGNRLDDIRHLFDGTGLMPIADARKLGFDVEWNDATHTATVSGNSKSVEIREPDKTVIVDKGQQALMAYQGSHLVLLTHVSTGREGHGTPNGQFTAGPAKERMHRSRLYNFAPMPYSVQVAGNVFIHGYTSVPNEPASHGCIRMPLTGGNPARYFYNWVDIGTPVTIKGVWSYRFASHWRHGRHHRHGFRFAYRHHRSRHHGVAAAVITATRGTGNPASSNPPVSASSLPHGTEMIRH